MNCVHVHMSRHMCIIAFIVVQMKQLVGLVKLALIDEEYRLGDKFSDNFINLVIMQRSVYYCIPV